MTAAPDRRLPMFPLGTVLVPHAPLPLQVFEPRYRALLDDVLGGDERFGVVLIARGSEVGGGDQRTAVGTVATVVRAAPTGDGRWAVLAVGGARIDVVEWHQDDPYPLATVRERPERTLDAAASGALEAAERAVRRTLAWAAEAGDRAVPATVELDDDPSVRVWQLLAIAPIALLDRHALLAVDDHPERLRRLTALVEDEAAVLAQRLRGL